MCTESPPWRKRLDIVVCAVSDAGSTVAVFNYIGTGPCRALFKYALVLYQRTDWTLRLQGFRVLTTSTARN